MIIGHSQLVKDFKQLVKNGRLAHGYIFFGEPEVGKFFFAKHLAYLLENGEFERPLASSAENQLRRPMQDALIIDAPSTAATAGRASSGKIGIDLMREIKSFLWQKPNISPKRLVIINDSENLTPQAQNAILKITEEPPESAVIILIVNQLENLLPPLLSRLQKIHFGRLSDEEMRGMANLQPSTLNLKTIPDYFGRPGRAMRLLSDEIAKTADRYADDFLRSSGPARSNLIKELVNLQKDLSEKEDRGSKLLDYFFESLILKLRKDPIRNAVVLKDVLHRLFLIKSYNVNKRLQLEAI